MWILSKIVDYQELNLKLTSLKSKKCAIIQAISDLPLI